MAFCISSAHERETPFFSHVNTTGTIGTAANELRAIFDKMMIACLQQPLQSTPEIFVQSTIWRDAVEYAALFLLTRAAKNMKHCRS